MKLEELLGEELYAQVQAKLDVANASEPDKRKHIRYADLSEGDYVSKAKYESLDAERKSLEGQVETLSGTIKSLKDSNLDNEELQKTVIALQAELKDQQIAAANAAKTYALREHLSKAGVLDPDYLIYKAGGIDKFTFSKENAPVGVEEFVKPYREDAAMAHLFKQAQDKPPYRPQNGGMSNGTNPFAKESYNLTKQGELLRSNPEQARSMAAAAGVTI